MFRDDFELVSFLQKMVVRESRDNLSQKNVSYEKFNKFCSLFDANWIYEKVRDVKPEDVEDYNNTIGYFIQGYEQQKSLNNENMRVKSIYSEVPPGK